MSNDFSDDLESFPPADEKRRRFSGIWILPIVAALISGYLAIRSYMEHGPDIAISFKSAEGLSVGQTQIKYKAVTLGTVKSIELKPDLSGILVKASMTSSARNFLTDHAKFWVVRPQLNAANISDFQLLVSGTYIQIEPGAPGGDKRTSFTGLEQPPDMRSDQSGRVYLLKAAKLGPIGIGSPVYFRDIEAGQILNYDIGDGTGPIILSVFVRDPYAQFVRPDSRFWNVSGVNVKLSGGLHIEFQSLQSLLSGGIAFGMPDKAVNEQQAEARTTFPLYNTKQEADMADGVRFHCVSYFQSAIKDLAPGSPVQIYGVYVGEVTDVKLVFDPEQNKSRIRVAFDIKPNLAFGAAADNNEDTVDIMHNLVQKGMRATLSSSDLVAGYQLLSLQFSPKSQPVEIANEGDAMIVPGVAGSDISGAVADIAGKLGQIPFDQIGDHLNHLLTSADTTFGGPEMKQAVHDLADTMSNAQKITKAADENLTPALQKLPEISNQLQSAIAHANEFMGSVNSGYGENSDFHRSVKRVMDEVNDASRSIRLLADYLDRHPEALLAGKSETQTLQKDDDKKDLPKDAPKNSPKDPPKDPANAVPKDGKP
jgi:paraquat-inducible protein B